MFYWDKSKTYRKSYKWLQDYGFLDEKGNLAPSCDPARINWGESWRLPTLKEIDVLLRNTFPEFTSYNGVKGCLVKSKINGNTIFLPASGWKEGSSLYCVGEYGMYWGATPEENYSKTASYLYFYSKYFLSGWYRRYYGFSVRPVSF